MRKGRYLLDLSFLPRYNKYVVSTYFFRLFWKGQVKSLNRGHFCAATLFFAAAVFFSGCRERPPGGSSSALPSSPSALSSSGIPSSGNELSSSAKKISSALRSAAEAKTSSAKAADSAAALPAAEAQKTIGSTGQQAADHRGTYRAPSFASSPFNSSAAAGQNGAFIDTSSSGCGYVAAKASSGKRLKFQVIHDGTTYSYDLPGNSSPTSFPLQTGSGNYTFRVMQNTTGNKYATLYSVTKSVSLRDSFQPFLRPNQFVDYCSSSSCVRKAASLASSADSDVEVAASIYAYIRDHIRYDHAKASSVSSGYVPNPDSTLASGTGICFDYASLAAAMLRSQGIPTKLITGYVSPGSLYHAWNMIWLDSTGWIAVNLKATGGQWDRIDLTFAAGGANISGTGYTNRYTY